MASFWTRRQPETIPDGELPEALRGKTPEQIAAELKSLQDLKAEHETLKAGVEAKDQQLATLQNDLTSVRSQITTLERGRTAPNPDAAAGPTSVLDDENKAFNERLAPTQRAAMEAKAMTARLVAENRIRSNPLYARLMSKYGSEVDAMLSKIDISYLQFPETYERVLMQVIGSKLPEITASKEKAEGLLFVESPGSSQATHTEDKEALTPEEQEIARKMKVDPAKYLENKKKMIGQGGHFTFARSA